MRGPPTWAAPAPASVARTARTSNLTARILRVSRYAGSRSLARAHHLYVVAVKVDEECRVVLRAVVGAHAGLAVVFGARLDSCLVEFIDGRPVRRPQGNV